MQRSLLLATISAAALWAGVASGQEAPATGEEVEEVVVTGSRIARRDFVSTSPIVTVGEEVLQRGTTVTVEAALNQLPQFVQGQNQSAIGAVANGGRATLNLRGLGETRNLVLLDGRRLPLSSAFAVVDVNLIPNSIVESVETISGGASAVYGSDAISGVVNFKTKRNFEGVQLDARAGVSEHGDAATTDISLTAGGSLIDGRARAMLSLSYSDRDVMWGYQRPKFFSQGVLSSFIGQGTFVPAGNNLPSQAAVNAVFARYGVAPGTVLNTRSLGFNDDGTLFGQIGVVNYKGPTTDLWSTVGGTVRQPVTMQEYIVQPLSRYGLFAKFDYDLSDTVSAYAQILHSNSRVTGQVGWSPTLFVVPTVPSTNPFIPADLRTILASRANPTADFTLNERFVGFADRKFHTDSNVNQVVLGFRGDAPVQDWKWDVYGSYDEMERVDIQDKALLLSRMRQLLYASDGGRSLCAGGFNPFGLGPATSVSQACRDFVEAETHDYTRLKQYILEGNLTGRLIDLPAGEARFSLTGTYRKNQFSFEPDPAKEFNDVIGTLSNTPAGGRVSVKEAAIELLIPLLKDVPFADSLEATVGYRISDYNVTGTEHTYKADGAWKPVPSLLIRGGYERAIRAPNIGELFSSAQAGQGQIGSPPAAGDPCDTRSSARTGSSAAQVRALCVATGVPANLVDTYQYTTVAVASVFSGSTALTPEKADTYTLGAVWQVPSDNPWLSGIRFSADYYDISISNVISQVGVGVTINKCYNLDGTNPTYSASNLYCGLLTRDATGGISVVSTPYLNLGGLKTSGLDLQADWSLSLEEAGVTRGSLKANVVVSFLDSYKVQILPGTPFLEYRDTIDGTQAATTPPVGLPLPTWKLFSNVVYRLGPADVGLRWRHLPSIRDVTAVTRPASPSPGVKSYDIFDLTGGWAFSEKLQLRGGVTNLFDKQPLVVGGVPGQTQPGTYDVIGRSFYLQLTSRF